LQSVSLTSQQQWTEMVHQHASDLEQQLAALHDQLGELSTSATALPNADAGSVLIATPLQFGQASNRLLQQVQELNRRVSNVFAPGTSGEDQTSQDDSVDAIIKVIPMQQAREINSFAMELSSSRTPPAVEQQSPDRPR
jgi:hypothetical protein